MPSVSAAALTSAQESRTSPGRCKVDTLNGATEDAANRVGELVDAHTLPRRHVEHTPEGSFGLGCEKIRRDDIANVREVAYLFSVSVDSDHAAFGDSTEEQRYYRGVLRQRILSFPEDVEVSQCHCLESVDAVEAEAVALGRAARRTFSVPSTLTALVVRGS